ncbi:uncharacterized protein LOC112048545 isoform X2 [Bicyclus anynana]|uniref:Uncharacterized protein LOC112048545 isoform X2 n=1 Tax=Bicyclus anynana TaxID=110368 RepID=A0ABM3LRB4_BICAN|nr:uncharacterized protein LOC112048545 isoform X2 [Bicyclus anynana]
MGLTSNTGLLASVQEKYVLPRQKSTQETELRCEVAPAPFMLRPYAGLYNPFSHACSVLCNHPADNAAREFVKKAKDAWFLEGKGHLFQEDLSKFQDQEKEKNRTPHDIVTEDMFRRYAETDSRPLTPAPTLASGKSRGSRRCLTPDQPHQRTTIVLDLRRSHSQETLYYHGYGTSEITAAQSPSVNERSTLPSLNLSGGAHRLVNQCEQLPPLASPLVLAKRTPKEPVSVRSVKKNQLKALNLGKVLKNKKADAPASQRSKDKEDNDGSEQNVDEGGGEIRRRGKRRRKGRTGGSDRLTSAGLAAQAQQDPETQISGIVTDSQNPSSRGSVAKADDDILLPVVKSVPARKTDSFLDDDILKYLHREVDEDAIETEFDTKRRYVLEEALRTRPERQYGQEMQTLLREYRVPAVSLGDWLHIPRVFSRQNAQFSLPLDSNALESISPMNYAARFVTVKKSKQLLYVTVLRKFRSRGYRMPIKADAPTIKFRTWCGLCAICERMYGRLPPREKDPPDGMELSDFTMIETRLVVLKVHSGLIDVLNTVRSR